MNHYTEYSDEGLLLLLKKVNENAFNTIYHHYWEKLYNVAFNVLKDEAFCQDTFMMFLYGYGIIGKD